MQTHNRDATFSERSCALSEAQVRALDVAPWRVPVWLWGESGTGKTALARHLAGDDALEVRACDLAPEHVGPMLVDSDGMALVVEGIEDAPHETQRRLACALDTRRIQLWPSGHTWEVEPRIVVTSAHAPQRWMAAGGMVSALVARLCGLVVRLPPLRERPDLAVRLAVELGERQGVAWSDEALAALVEHDWPGNGHEMRALVRLLSSMCRGRPVEPSDVTGLLPEPETRTTMLVAEVTTGPVDDAKSGMPDNVTSLPRSSGHTNWTEPCEGA